MKSILTAALFAFGALLLVPRAELVSRRFAFLLMFAGLAFAFVEAAAKYHEILKFIFGHPFIVAGGLGIAALVAFHRVYGVPDGPWTRVALFVKLKAWGEQVVTLLRLPAKTAREFANIVLILITLGSAVWWGQANKAREDAVASFERSLAAVQPDPSVIAARVTDRLAAELRRRLQTIPANVETARQEIDLRKREAIGELAAMRLPRERAATVESQIGGIADRANDRVSAEMDEAATRGLEEAVANMLRSMRRDDLPEAGAKAVAEAKPARVARARDEFAKLDGPDLHARAQRLVDEAARDLEHIASAAMEAAVRNRLAIDRTALENTAQERAMARGWQLASEAKAEMDALLNGLRQTLVQEEKERQEAAKQEAARRIAAGILQQRAAAVDGERAQIEGLRSRLRSLGFNLCEHTDVNGTSLRLDQRIVGSVEQCAARCNAIGGCDGFRTNPDGASFYCMPFANTKSIGTFSGVMSGKRGTC